MPKTEVTGTQIKDQSVSLTADVTGVLPVANGGSGASTIALNNVVLGNGTSAVQTVAPGTSHNVLKSDGTTWSSAAITNLTNPTITNYTETLVNVGVVTGSRTIDITAGTVQHITFTASTQCTFTFAAASAGKSFVIFLKQPAATGGGSAVWPATVKWGTSGTPTITSTAGKMDIVSFISDGTNWYGSIAQGYTY